MIEVLGCDTMNKLFILCLLPFLAGCASCTTCLTEEVHQLSDQERRSFLALNTVIPEFFKEEASGIKGLGKDTVRQFDYESADPRTYFEDFHQIFCPCH